MAEERQQPGIRPDLQKAHDGEPVQKTLDDFVVEVISKPWQDFHFLKTEDLEQAIRDGTLSEKAIIRGLGIKPYGDTDSLSSRIRQIEIEEANGKDNAHKPLVEYRAMHQAREHYIPADDNLTFDLFSDDGEKLQRDFSQWLRQKPGRYSYKRDYLNSADEAIAKISTPVEDRQREDPRVSADIVLDYPTLSHSMTIEPISKGPHFSEESQFLEGGEYRLPLMFFRTHGSAVEGTVFCPADMLSLVRMANEFKAQGHSVRMQMSQNPIGNIRYMAR